MADADIIERAQEERRRLTDILNDAGVSKRRQSALAAVIENVAWMKVKLDGAREAVKNSQIVISYDNGGGQKGIRENPLYKGYEALFKSYMLGMNRILDALPLEAAAYAAPEEEKPQNVLTMIRAKHKREA